MIQLIKMSDTAKLPTYMSEFASGADLYSDEGCNISPGEIKIINTGLQIAYITPGYELQIRPRSSVGAKGVIIPNSPGTIDNDYRGLLKVILMNLNSEYFPISKGDRIAQMIFIQIGQCAIQWGDKIFETKRGEHGFGSTGR